MSITIKNFQKIRGKKKVREAYASSSSKKSSSHPGYQWEEVERIPAPEPKEPTAAELLKTIRKEKMTPEQATQYIFSKSAQARAVEQRLAGTGIIVRPVEPAEPIQPAQKLDIRTMIQRKLPSPVSPIFTVEPPYASYPLSPDYSSGYTFQPAPGMIPAPLAPPSIAPRPSPIPSPAPSLGQDEPNVYGPIDERPRIDIGESPSPLDVTAYFRRKGQMLSYKGYSESNIFKQQAYRLGAMGLTAIGSFAEPVLHPIKLGKGIWQTGKAFIQDPFEVGSAFKTQILTEPELVVGEIAGKVAFFKTVKFAISQIEMPTIKYTEFKVPGLEGKSASLYKGIAFEFSTTGKPLLGIIEGQEIPIIKDMPMHRFYAVSGPETLAMGHTTFITEALSGTDIMASTTSPTISLPTKIAFGTPEVYLEAARSPFIAESAVQTAIVRKSLYETAKAGEAFKFGEMWDITDITKKVKSKYITETFKKNIETLPSRGVDIILETAKKNKMVIYGSFSAAQQMPENLARKPADIDIHTKLSQEETIDITKDIAQQLEKAGIPIRITAETPTLIEAKTTSMDWQPAVDIHSIEEIPIEGIPLASGKKAFGLPLFQRPIKIGGTKVMRLSEQGVRKFASAAILNPTEEGIILSPPEHRITRDIPDWFTVQEVLLKSKKFKTTELQKMQLQRLETLKEFYPSKIFKEAGPVKIELYRPPPEKEASPMPISQPSLFPNISVYRSPLPSNIISSSYMPHSPLIKSPSISMPSSNIFKSPGSPSPYIPSRSIPPSPPSYRSLPSPPSIFRSPSPISPNPSPYKPSPYRFKNIYNLPKSSMLPKLESQKKKRKKAARKEELVSFAPKYVPSIKAQLFNIKGPKPGKFAIAAGLGTRPLLKGM